MNYTILIPAYNEENTIGNVLQSLSDIKECSEIIVVDDGSKDNTGEIAESAGANVIQHTVNKGYGASLKTGIMVVKTEYVILFDGDGQHQKEDLIKISEEMDKHDMVVGARDKNSHQPLFRRPGKYILKWIVNFLTGKKIPDINSGLRSFKVSVIKQYLHLMPQGFSFSTTSTVAFNKMNYDVKYIPITVNKRSGDKSTVRIFRDGIRAFMLILNLIVLFSPLRVFLPMSFAFIFASGVYFTIYSLTIRVHITASMVMLFVTGMLIFFMGIICEQISAIRREINLIK